MVTATELVHLRRCVELAAEAVDAAIAALEKFRISET